MTFELKKLEHVSVEDGEETRCTSSHIKCSGIFIPAETRWSVSFYPSGMATVRATQYDFNGECSASFWKTIINDLSNKTPRQKVDFGDILPPEWFVAAVRKLQVEVVELRARSILTDMLSSFGVAEAATAGLISGLQARDASGRLRDPGDAASVGDVKLVQYSIDNLERHINAS